VLESRANANQKIQRCSYVTNSLFCYPKITYEPVIILASRTGDRQMVDLLAKYGADPNERDEKGVTALEHLLHSSKQ
jgi:hypothetical protein